MNRALKSLDAVGRLVAYKPTEAQATSIVNALSGKLTEVKNQLAGSRNTGAFSIPPAA